MHTMILIFHIIFGTVSVVSGFIGLFSRKGSPIHRKAGQVFVYSMLLMGVSGTVLAIMTNFVITAFAGLFTCYLIVTAWRIIVTKPNTVSKVDYVSALVALAIMLGCGFYGVNVMNTPEQTLDGIPYGAFFFFAGLSAIALAFDIRMLITGGLNPTQRLARHLWRISFAFYLSIGSFIEQSGDLIPKVVRDSGMLELPTMLVLAVMVFYLLKTHFWKRFREWRRSQAKAA